MIFSGALDAHDVLHASAGVTRPLWDYEGARLNDLGWQIEPLVAPASCSLQGWANISELLEGARPAAVANRKPWAAWSEKRRIVDAVIYNGESDMLELRLAEIGSLIDGLVVVESCTTFTGIEKPRFLLDAAIEALTVGRGPLARSGVLGVGDAPESLSKLQQLAAQDCASLRRVGSGAQTLVVPTRHGWPLILVDASGWMDPSREASVSESAAFSAEGLHRTSIMSGLQALRPPLRVGFDLILSNDLDEIPNADVLTLAKHCDWRLPHDAVTPEVGSLPWERAPSVTRDRLHLEMAFFLYSFEWRVGVVRKAALNVFPGFSESWYVSHSRRSDRLLAGAGWHCSFCFPLVTQVVDKVRAYSHASRATKPLHTDPDHVQRAMCRGADLFGHLPEAYSLRAVACVHRRQRSIVDAPHGLRREPTRWPFLLPGRCVRQDAPASLATADLVLPFDGTETF